jgi:hypothetical protein
VRGVTPTSPGPPGVEPAELVVIHPRQPMGSNMTAVEQAIVNRARATDSEYRNVPDDVREVLDAGLARASKVMVWTLRQRLARRVADQPTIPMHQEGR